MHSLVSVLAATFFANPVGKFVRNANPQSWKSDDNRSGTASAILALGASTFLTPIGWVYFAGVIVLSGLFSFVASAALPAGILSIVLAICIPIVVVPASFLYIQFLYMFLLGVE